MTSKVLVKLPTVPFSQGKKAPPEMMTLASRNEGLTQIKHQGYSGDRAAQLEQNIKFLQDQHQTTLAALHQEVEILRQKNRDLQFQLIFSKDTACIPSSPSSPEDNGNGFVKPKGSPVCINATPLQVELLEKDLQDIKTSLQEAKTYNQHLSGIIERQKKRLDFMEERKEKLVIADVGVQVEEGSDPIKTDLITRLEDAEAMVKRLLRENEDQRKEVATIKAASVKSSGSGSGRNRGNNNGYHSRGSTGSMGQEQSSHKFPPLQTQSYWHRSSRGNHSVDYKTGFYRIERSRQDKQDHVDSDVDSTILPQLRNGSVKSDSSSYPSYYRPRGYDNGGSYYREGGNRKYRYQRSQKDHRESESRDHRRDFRDRDSKDQHRELSDSAEGLRDSKNHQKQ